MSIMSGGWSGGGASGGKGLLVGGKVGRSTDRRSFLSLPASTQLSTFEVASSSERYAQERAAAVGATKRE